MSENHVPGDRVVKNPLFTASVTGATFEEFQQNALLMPAPNLPEPAPPAPEVQNLGEVSTDFYGTYQEDLLNQNPSGYSAGNPYQNQSESTGFYYQSAPQEQTEQPQNTSSHFSSVFSTFSSILNFGSSGATAKKTPTPPPPASSIENLISNGNPDVNPIPLFNPSELVSDKSVGLAPALPPSANPAGNSYRRTGAKKAVYAAIPGLSLSSNSPLIGNQATPPSQLNLSSSVTPPLSNFNQPIQPQNNSFAPLNPYTSSQFFQQPLQTSQPDPSQNNISSFFNSPPTSNIHNQAQFPLNTPVQSSSLQTVPLDNTNQNFFQNNFSSSTLSSESSKTPPLNHFISSAIQTSNTPPNLSFVSQPPVPQNPYITSALPSNPPLSSALLPPLPPQSNQFQQKPFITNLPLTQPQLPSVSALPKSTNTTPFLEPVDDIFLPNTETFSSNTPIMASLPVSNVTQPESIDHFPKSATPISNDTNMQIYRPVYHHWFHMKKVETKVVWTPFSMTDSLALESAFATDLTPDDVIATDGGRFDVNILKRQRVPVYWTGETNEVRRCSWFHKCDEDGKFRPYEENIAAKLEEEYKVCFESGQWNHNVSLANGDTVTFHSADVLVVFGPTPEPDSWGNTPQQPRPQIVKRGVSDFDIDEGESEKIDHILFLVHGIGSVCDLKFRTVEEVVDEFRSIALQLVRTHYKSSHDNGLANRIELLPISWHSQLHSEETGIDNVLKSITLDSIQRLRNFTNDTLLDILFYTSPVYCQTIINTVGNELNRVYELFKRRNPDFAGSVYLGGHSLGSLILFDILSHQHPEPEKEEQTPDGDGDTLSPLQSEKPHPKDRRISRRISYMMSSIGTGQAQITYPHLTFQPTTFFALGSPVGMFVAVRGLDQLGENFSLPTCPGFFNIFHPYDPVAYRIESLVNPELASLKPVLIPHHKGRKRMHLELKETMARVGADFKQKLMDSVKTTLGSFYQLSLFRSDPTSSDENKVAEEKQDESDGEFSLENKMTDLSLGILNRGRRIDYVLQEAPVESLNEYFFALASHCCYWGSSDTMLLILKEIYTKMGLTTDNQIPQQTMTIERPPLSPKSQRGEAMQTQINPPMGMDPTVPIKSQTNLQPPPIAGFVRKS